MYINNFLKNCFLITVVAIFGCVNNTSKQQDAVSENAVASSQNTATQKPAETGSGLKDSTGALPLLSTVPKETSAMIVGHARPQAKAAVGPSNLKDALLKKNIYFGTYFSEADVNVETPRPANYLQQVSQYFNLYSIPAWFHHTEYAGPGKFNFSGPDKVADFAVAHNAKIHAHNLVWYTVLPPWVTNGHFTPDQLKAILKNHVQTVVKHYKDKYGSSVIAWDVVNEPLASDYNQPSSYDAATGLRNTIWSVIHKPNSNDPSDYIQYAFEWAHEANPDVKLYINEGDVEYKCKKWNNLYSLVKHLKDKGVPIDGVGFQTHLDTHFDHPFSEFLDNMKLLGDLGLDCQITEMDVVVSTAHVVPWSASPMAAPASDDFRKQASIYKGVLNACLQAKNCSAFIVFGAWDVTTPQDKFYKDKQGKYLGGFKPNLLDANFTPKQAFKSLADDVNSSQ